MKHNKKLIQYGVWEPEQDNGDGGYWNLFDSIEDAVSTGGDGTHVYRLDATSLGKFIRKVEIVKAKKRKKL